jgi:hypothetical protein
LCALRLDFSGNDVGPIRLADIKELAGDADRLAGDPGELAPHLDQLLRAERLIIVNAHGVQDALLLSRGVGLSLSLLLGEDVAALAELARGDDALLNEEKMLALLRKGACA